MAHVLASFASCTSPDATFGPPWEPSRSAWGRERTNLHTIGLHEDGWLIRTGKGPRGVIEYALAVPRGKSVTQPVSK